MVKQTKNTTKPVKKAATKKAPVNKQPKKKIIEPAVERKPVIDDHAADAFIMEVDEEVKNDNLREFFKKYGLFITLFVVLILSATVSFETIKNWRDNQFRTKTDAYLAANSAAGSEEMLTALEKIAAGNNGIYSELARLQMTDILFEQGKNDDAFKMLEVLSSNDELNPRVKNLAAVKLAARKVDTADFEEIEALLNPVISADDSWSPVAREYMALSAIKSGNVEKARELYQQILQDGRVSEEFRARVQDMLTAISDV